MKKILVYSTRLENVGGIESHLVEFCNAISSQGVKIDLIVPNFSMDEQNEAHLRKICHECYFFQSKKSWLRFLWLQWTKLKLYATFKSYDAIYTNGQGSSIIQVGKYAWAKKWVHHHHTAGDLIDQKSWSKSYRNALSEANEIIACSTYNASLVEEVIGRRIMSIPCFSQEIQRREHPISGKVKFGYFGRLIPEKGIDILCKLSNDSDLQKSEFHIWGEGVKYTAESFKNYPNLHYHGGFRGKESLTKVINTIDAYLLISTHKEGLPVSLLEVMSAGVPWMSTDKGGIRDIVCDPMTTRLISAEFTYESIKDEVVKFQSDLLSGKVNSLKQKKQYEEKFSSKAITKKWMGVLEI